MPVHTRSIHDRRAGDRRYQDLKQRLVDEWLERGGTPPAPDINQETDAQGRLVNVVVSWDEWADLDAQTRSELIVDALREAKGVEAVQELALAMGITSAEGVRLARGA